MTIHKSKGLEFPVVINYLNYKNKESEYWQYIPEDFVLSISLSEKESLNINEFSGLLFYLPLKDIELIDSQKYEALKEEEILEAINTMYVSFTRAIERLYIIADKKNDLYNKLLNPKISDYKNNNEEKHQKSKSVISSVAFISGKEEKKLPDEIKNESDDNTIIIQHSTLNNKNNILLSSDEIKYSDERMWGIKVHRMIEFLENSNIDKAISKGIVNGIILSEETEEIRNILNNIVRHPVLSDFFDEEKTECIYNEPEIFSFDDTILSDSIDIKRPDKIILTKENKVILLEFKTGIQDEKHKLQLNKYLHVVRNIYKNKRICEGYLIYLNGDNFTVEKV